MKVIIWLHEWIEDERKLVEKIALPYEEGLPLKKYAYRALKSIKKPVAKRIKTAAVEIYKQKGKLPEESQTFRAHNGQIL